LRSLQDFFYLLFKVINSRCETMALNAGGRCRAPLQDFRGEHGRNDAADPPSAACEPHPAREPRRNPRRRARSLLAARVPRRHARPDRRRVRAVEANILYYFEGKEAIFVALLNELIDTWLEPLRRIDPEGDPLTEILRYVRRKLQMSAEMPRESRLFANEIVQGAPRFGNALAGALKDLFDEKCALLARWMAEGRIATVDPQHLIFSIWATTQHYADFEAQIRLLRDDRSDPTAGASGFLDILYVRLLTP
jgi:TetR/AcrR family transcriptional regulator